MEDDTSWFSLYDSTEAEGKISFGRDWEGNKWGMTT